MLSARYGTLVILIAVLVQSEVAAQDVGELLKCKEIKSEIGRLNCYDAVAAKVGSSNEIDSALEVPDEELRSDFGSWQVEEGIDPITDAVTFTAALESTGGSSFNKPVLFVRCRNQSAEVFIAWGDYLSENTSVTIRFGDDEPSTFRWDPSTDQTATFLYAARQQWFFDTAMKVDKIAAQITPYQSGPVTAIFDTRGMSNAFADRGQLCGFPEKE